MKAGTIATVFVAGLLVTGCATTPDADDLPEAPLGDGKLDGQAKPLGDYEITSDNAPIFSRIVLLNDKTFNVLVGGAGEMGGTYKLTSNSAGTHYLRLTDPDSNELITRCRYTSTASELHIYPVTTSETMQTPCEDEKLTLHTDHPWCDTETDCTNQELAHPDCVGAWTCDSGCSYSCS